MRQSILFCLDLKPKRKENQDRNAVLIHLQTVDLSGLAYQPIALGNHKEICG